MRILRGVIIVLLSTLFACNADSDIDPLVDNPLLGTWEIAANSHNQSIECCEFLEFSLDENKEDFVGKFLSYNAEFNAAGTFEYFEFDRTILLKFENAYELNELQIQASILILKTMTIDNDILTRTYRKVD